MEETGVYGEITRPSIGKVTDNPSQLHVRLESSAPARAWFELTTTTNEKIEDNLCKLQ